MIRARNNNCCLSLPLVGLALLFAVELAVGSSPPIEPAELEAFAQVELQLEHSVHFNAFASVTGSRSHEAIMQLHKVAMDQPVPKEESSRAASERGELRALLDKLILLYDLKEETESPEAVDTFRRLSEEVVNRLAEVKEISGEPFDKLSDHLTFIVASNAEKTATTDRSNDIHNNNNDNRSDTKQEAPTDDGNKKLSLFERIWRSVFHGS